MKIARERPNLHRKFSYEPWASTDFRFTIPPMSTQNYSAYSSLSNETPSEPGTVEEKVATDPPLAGSGVAAVERLLASRDSLVDRSKW
jgi:hypothetical protein